jgi:phosphatidylserine/phosphatidylglycerophosphate/cardiolipin synthase-like enzyme/uncharacterized membrane protein YdjX (TVP38/TMEM64 family)
MTVLRPGTNVWRTARADRFAFFRDVAGCFGAMRDCMRRAERSITIVGWDIDSRTRLIGASGMAEDGFPCELRPFLQALKQRKPDLQINLLLWDFAPIYALEREAFPRVKLAWDGVDLVLDSCLPIGSSQHQKIVVVDESVAFSGGLDVTIRRWDTAEHHYRNPLRVDPNAQPYNPFHDVQAVVDGGAAKALSELVAERWRCASGDALTAGASAAKWPEGLDPLFRDVDVGICRTVPMQDGVPEVREAERLFLDMIDAAQKSIYIENQFLTSQPVAQRLAERLRACPDLELLFIAPKTHHSWLEAVAMRHGRQRFQAIVNGAGADDRVRFAFPEVRDGDKKVDVMVHSKVMIVDDHLLRIGSANLNNRSMGADSECDLVVEATTAEQRRAIAGARNTLLAMHCGVSRDAVDETLRTQSLIAASQRLSDRHHALVDIDDGSLDLTDYPGVVDNVADPERPIELDSFLALSAAGAGPGARRRAALLLAAAALCMFALAGAWGLHAGDADLTLRSVLRMETADWQIPLVVVGVFLLGSALMVPVTLMIVAAAATLGLGAGLIYAALGTLVSAAAFYAVGAWLGTGLVQRITGGRLSKIRHAIQRRGILAVAAVRVLPIAPFTLVNLAAGAVTVGLWRFLAGTVVGMAPGFVLLSALGDQLYRLLNEPTPAALAAVAGLILLWAAAALIIRRWARREARAE